MKTNNYIIILLIALLFCAPPALSDPGSDAHLGSNSEHDLLAERVAVLERAVEDQGATVLASQSVPSWVEAFHLSGNADFTYLYGRQNSIADEGRFAAENMRLFFDVDVAGEVRLFDRTIFESASFFFEWDLVREAELKNEAGSLYARLDRIGGSQALNLQFGRMPLPFGEEYLRFHQQRPENPLISYSAPAPYNWDEGVMLFGSLGDGASSTSSRSPMGTTVST